MRYGTPSTLDGCQRVAVQCEGEPMSRWWLLRIALVLPDQAIASCARDRSSRVAF